MFRLRFPTGVPSALALWAGASFGSLLPGWGWLLTGGGALLVSRFPAPAPLRPFLAFLAVTLVAGSAGAMRHSREPPPSLPTGVHHLAGRLDTWATSSTRVELSVWIHQRDSIRVHPPVRVRVLAPDSWGPAPQSGWIAFSGKVLPSRGVTNPGGWSSDRFSAVILVKGKTRPEWGPGETSLLLRSREALVHFIRGHVPGFSGRLAEAVLLGRSRALSDTERSMLRRCGASHLVAVSGLHVGLVALLAGLLLSPAPVPVRCAGAAATAWAYAALAGWSPSAVRAACLVAGWSLGAIFHRDRSPAAWLALALPWLLWFDSGLARSVGFLLSVSAVAGIVFILDLLGRGGSRLRRLGAPVAVSLGAQWGTLPVILSSFGQIAPFALLPNLLAIPVVGLFLPALLLGFVSSPVAPVSEMFLESVEGLGRALQSTLEFSGRHLPFVTGIPPAPFWVRLAFPSLVVIWFSLSRDLCQNARIRGAAAILAVILAGACFFPGSPPAGPWVAFLDVGQGDGAVLRLSDGSVWVVDVGDDRGGNAAQFVMLPFLRHQRIRRVDGLILSHRHRDHVGGLARFLEEMAVAAVYDAGYGSLVEGTPARVDSLLAAHRLWPCLVAAGDTLHTAAGASIVVLFPERGNPEEPHEKGNLNDASLVVRVRDGLFSVLFAGDIEAQAERGLLERTPAPVARVLKTGHHGSRTSSSPGFLDAVNPEWAVISCGEENRFGHPSPEVVDRFGCRGIRVARSDRDGAVWVEPAGTGVSVRTHPPRKRP